MKRIIIAGLMASLTSFSAFSNPLDEGALSVGGSARVPLKWDAFGNLSAGIDVMPSISYFFADNWELVAGLRVQGTFYQSEFVREAREPVRYGAQIGVNTYFDFNLGFFPYLGAAVGGDIADFKLVSTNLFVEVPIGIAFVVKEQLMITIGAPVRLIFSPPGVTTGTMHTEWCPGNIGLRVFF